MSNRITRTEYEAILNSRHKLVLQNIYSVIRRSLENNYKTIDIIYELLPHDNPFNIQRLGFSGNRVYCPINYKIGNIIKELRSDGYIVKIANLTEYNSKYILYRIIL